MKFILPMNYEPMSEGYGKIIARKMLHLALEHAATITNLGSINFMPFDDYYISNTAIFDIDPECPICSKKEIDHLIMVKYYRGIHPVVNENNK